MTTIEVFGFFMLCFLAALFAVLSSTYARKRLSHHQLLKDTGQRTIFLFDGPELIDASPPARNLLNTLPGNDSSWQSFTSWAARQFPNFAQHLESLPQTGLFEELSSLTPGLSIRAKLQGGVLRFEMLDALNATSPEAYLDTIAQRAINDELADLRKLSSSAPLPIWRENLEGTITWANTAAMALAESLLPPNKTLGWPITLPIDARSAGRFSLTTHSGITEWFDCKIEIMEHERIIFAQPISALVQSEQSLNNFVQTLTRTFAQLSIAMAVFDRNHKLQVFNPALTELTGLAPEFLITRPTLFRFLDAMREGGMLPEPKDYKAWRNRVAAIEASTNGGRYEETLHLSSGITYRLTVHAHPDGALALTFHDISDEISRTRRMRADLELGQAVIETSDEAIAVFSTAGFLLISNAAYARLWGHDLSSSLADHTIAGLARIWTEASEPTHLWEEARDYITTSETRTPRTFRLRLKDGPWLSCRMSPLTGGATMMGFTTEPRLPFIPDDKPVQQMAHVI